MSASGLTAPLVELEPSSSSKLQDSIGGGGSFTHEMQEGGRHAGQTVRSTVEVVAEAVEHTPERATENLSSGLDRFRHWWPSTMFPVTLQVINLLVSTACVLIYIFDTYYGISETLAIVYLAASVSYLIEYVFSVTTEVHFWRQVLSPAHIVDFCAICYGVMNFGFYYGGYDIRSFWRCLRFVQILRLFRALHTLLPRYWAKRHRPMEVEMFKVILNLMLVVLGVIFIGGMLFYELVDPNPDVGGGPQYLHNGWYWAAVTLTTIGYGDFFPNTTVTQLLLPLMLIFIFLVLPWAVSDVATVLITLNYYMRRRYASRLSSKHVVVVGSFDHDSAKSFIDEWFHPDKGYQPADVVLMHQEEMSPDMQSMIATRPFEKQIFYLQGSVFLAEDLGRTDLTKALAVYVLCDKFTSDCEKEDQNTLMTVLAISQYMRQYTGIRRTEVYGWPAASWMKQMQKRVDSPKKPLDNMATVIAQFHMPEYCERVKLLLAKQMALPLGMGALPVTRKMVFPVCIGDMKHTLIASNIRNPGISTLIANLSSSVRIMHTDRQGREHDMVNNMGWLEEYLRGAETEIYEMDFPPGYKGLTFKTAALRMYMEHHAILIAVGESTPTEYLMHMAPMAENKVVGEGVRIAYFLAKEQIIFNDAPPPAVKEAMEVTMREFGFDRQDVSCLPQIHVDVVSDGEAPTPRSPQQGEEHDGMLSYTRVKTIHRLGHMSEMVIRKDAVPMWHVFKKGSYMEETAVPMQDSLTGMRDPLIIIGSSCFEHLFILIRALRAGNYREQGPSGSEEGAPGSADPSGGSKAHPIIIMDPNGPNSVQYGPLASYDNLYLLKADPMLLTDMHKLGIVSGSSVKAIVLPSKRSLDKDSQVLLTQVSYTSDVETMQSCSNLLSYCVRGGSKLVMISEVESPMNAPYLLSVCNNNHEQNRLEGLHMQSHGQSTGITQMNHRNWFEVAADMVLFQFDKLKLSPEEHREAFLRRMLSRMPFLSPALSSGHVISFGFLDNLLCNTMFNPQVPSILQNLIGLNDTSPRIHSVPIPELLAHIPTLHKIPMGEITFNNLFVGCLINNMLPIGLYRADTLSGFPFVATNPSSDCKLRSNDVAFVVAKANDLPR